MVRAAAPETLDGTVRTTTAADVFSYGLICYELLSGCKAYPNVDVREHNNYAAPNLSALDKVSLRIVFAVFLRTTITDFGERWTTRTCAFL